MSEQTGVDSAARPAGRSATATTAGTVAPLASLPRLVDPMPPGAGATPSSLAGAVDRLAAALEALGSGPLSVMVCSTVPASGTTTFATHLAHELARRGTRAALVDADLARPEVAFRFGLEEPDTGLLDVLDGLAGLPEALVAAPDRPSLVLVPAGARSADLARRGLQAGLGNRAGPDLADIVRSLVADGRTVVLDSACLLDEDAVALAGTVHAVVVVNGPRRLPPRLRAHVDDRLRAVRANLVAVVEDDHALDVVSPSSRRAPAVEAVEAVEADLTDPTDPGPDHAVAAAADDDADADAVIDLTEPTQATGSGRVRPPVPSPAGEQAAAGEQADDELLRRLLSHLGVGRAAPPEPPA